MALIIRIDVDRPYGKQGLVRHVASRVSSDYFLPRMEWLRYLDELKTILRIMNANGRASHVFFRKCTYPNQEVCALMDEGGHQFGLHLENSRSYATFTEERESLEQFLGFFHNPCHFLLQNRLGIAFSREEETPADDEPFLPDFDARRALAERLLPQAMQGLDRQQLESLAAAGVEYPPGTLGLTLLDSEMGTLRRFADAFRQATAAACLAPVAVNLAFDIEGEDWELATVFSDLRPGGLVRHRYDDARPTDYLAGWLTHLVICAAPAVGMTLATQWISRDGSYRLAACPEARTILERLLRLYRSGLCEPLHFFPKAAWEYILTGRNLGKARAKWHPAYDAAHGEDRHAAYQLALRGKADPIDADFAHCAEVVFGPVEAYIDDVRLDLHQARASRPR